MDQHTSAGPDPGRVHDLGGLARELCLLRARAARGQSRSRISLDELARRVEKPRSTVHAYVTGKHLVPSEVLDRIVIALGATPAEQRGWNECWFRISTGDAGSGGVVASGGPGLDVPRQLPPDVDGFTGRADELAALDRRCAATPRLGIEVITGTGGVGKTALAVRWAHRNAAAFPDGHLCVDLRGYDPDQPVHPTDALAGFLRALGVDAATISPDMAERAALYRSLLDGRRMLVLLDNVRDSEQARPLLPGTASCLVLVTSRDSLAGLVARHGARRLDLDLLPGDDAVTLLRRLVGGRVRTEPDAAATVAAHCARLPLALRVAAERAAATPAATLGALADELADERHRLDLLDAGDDPRTAVRAVFSWSYRHLPAPAARLFRLLGLHPGREVDAAAAAALAGQDTDEVRRPLGLLARVHLLNEVSPGRYSMHDLMRTWAAERASADEPEHERLAASRRLVEHHLHATATAVDLLYPGDRHRRPEVPRPVTPFLKFEDKAAARTWLDTERATLVAIAGRAAGAGTGDRAHPTVLLSALLWRHLDVGCHHQEAERLHELALAVAHRDGDRAGQALALNNLGVLHWRLGRHPEAVERLRPALDLYHEVGDRLGVFRSLTNLGGVYWQLCQADRAAEYHAQALEVAIASGAGIDQAVALYNLGSQHERAGRYAEAHRCCVRALELYEAAGHRVGEVSVVAALGILATRQGRHAEAETLLRRALATGVELGNRKAEARIHGHLGALYERMGRHREAAGLHQLALDGHDAARDRTGRADALVGLATACVRLGEHERAERLCQEALDLADEIEHRLGLATASNALGEALRAGGDAAAAAAAHLDAERHAAAIGDRYEQGRAFEGLAHAHHDLGDHDRAHEYRGRALTVYTDLGVPDAAALIEEEEHEETGWTTAGTAP